MIKSRGYLDAIATELVVSFVCHLFVSQLSACHCRWLKDMSSSMADSGHLLFVESSGELVAVPVLAEAAPEQPGDAKSDSKSENTSGSSSGSGSRTGGETRDLRQEARSSSTLQSGTKLPGDSSSSGTTDPTADPRLSSRHQTQSGRNTRSSGSHAFGATDESIALDPSAGVGKSKLSTNFIICHLRGGIR